MEVHRVRFFDFVPQAVHCLAFSDSGPSRLALSRGNGNIEVWNVENDWHQELVIHGSTDWSVETLVWFNGRLFTAGLNGVISEWNLLQLSQKMEVDSYGGAVWHLAVRPGHQQIAAACEDGCIRLFDVLADGLQYAKSLTSQSSARILSVGFHADGNMLVSGGADSIVRLWKIDEGLVVRRITLAQPRQDDVLVWTLALLRDMTVVCGDSAGRIQLWDGRHGSMLQSFNLHMADVLSLVVDQDEKTIFASGVDCKIVRLERVVEGEDQHSKWLHSGTVRANSHDVRALALAPSEPLLVSGGVDTNIIIFSLLKEFGQSSTARVIPAFPSVPPAVVCRERDLLLLQYNHHVDVWSLGSVHGERSLEDKASGTALPVGQQPLHLLHLKAKAQHNIMASCISPCGKWLALSDHGGTRVFRLKMTGHLDETKVSVQRVADDLTVAMRMAFLPNSSALLLATQQRTLQMIDLSDEEDVSLPTVLFRYEDSASEGWENTPFSHLSVSPCGHWAALANCSSQVIVFDLKKKKVRYALPRLPHPATALAFLHCQPTLAVVTTHYELFTVNYRSGDFKDCSEYIEGVRAPLRRKSKVLGMLVLDGDRLALYSHYALMAVDLAKPPGQVHARKRKAPEADAAEADDAKALVVTERFGPVLAAGLTNEGGMVIVERPWQAILAALPPTLHRVRYGT